MWWRRATTSGILSVASGIIYDLVDLYLETICTEGQEDEYVLAVVRVRAIVADSTNGGLAEED